ncbi:MAG: polyprenyl synthetase family protein [Tannerella sp.]|jgi:geranylgeranyl pyrophosphate synthase|nr:polyprenyl synthetase family protein [Tannerella sp.]
MEDKQTYKVPPTLKERCDLRNHIDSCANERSLTPPLSMNDLSRLSDMLINARSLNPEIKGWLMVEFNNCAWRKTVAAVPCERRILLLPKCLAHSDRCEAGVDELGLLCHRCGHCSIPGLQDEADRLGMMSIVAEGFTAVIELIENRVVDTVIGVGCLESLEKVFPLLIDGAVPGLAVPLNVSGCRDTDVDRHYVEELIGMRSEEESRLLDYGLLKSTVGEWFSAGNLKSILTPASEQTSSAALEWISNGGKRWRPYLLAAIYQALSRPGEEIIPDEIRLAAVAVECFHKASLVHDDIQDNDLTRYGKQTVNARHGVPVAINVGDILLGEGYRLLSQCGRMELVKIAADAHIALCKGQGMELEWSRSPRPVTMDFVLEIFCNKTAPAFEVALMTGMICAGGDAGLGRILHHYSRSLGIAYQLLDDIADFETEETEGKPELRPSAVLAALCGNSPDSGFVDALLSADNVRLFMNRAENQPLLRDALDKVRAMSRQYHDDALEALREITNVELKRLLFRVAKRILKQNGA